jgi:hypothetical protein
MRARLELKGRCEGRGPCTAQDETSAPRSRRTTFWERQTPSLAYRGKIAEREEDNRLSAIGDGDDWTENDEQRLVDADAALIARRLSPANGAI